MEHSEKEFINRILTKLTKNIFSYIPSDEYEKYTEKSKTKWLMKKEANSKACNKCFAKNCHIEFDTQDELLPCPHGVPEIIEIKEQDRFHYFFDWDLFFNTIMKELALKGAIVQFKNFYILGQTEYKKSNWKVVFSFGKHIERSIGDLIEFHLRHETTFTLLLVDEIPKVDDFKLSIFQNLGIFVCNWAEFENGVIEKIYQTKRAELEVRKEIEAFPIEDVKQKLLATLERAATSGDGDWFEDEVYKTFRKISPYIVPFGAQYKGFSIPDGMIFGGEKYPFPIIFYDCKSSHTDDYAIKPSVAMQVNYYMDFLNHFYNQTEKYKNSGFIIFAEEFNGAIQKRIEGSPQWKQVQEKCTLFFIDRKCLDKIESLMRLDGINGLFNKADIFEICFREEINILQDSQTQQFYEKLFPVSPYRKVRYINPEQLEVAFVASVINEFYKDNFVDGTRADLKEALRKSNHDNKRRRGIKPPLFFSFLEEVKNMAKADLDMALFHPLTSLLLINRNEDPLIELLGEDIVSEIAERAEQKIELLIKEITSFS